MALQENKRAHPAIRAYLADRITTAEMVELVDRDPHGLLPVVIAQAERDREALDG